MALQFFDLLSDSRGSVRGTDPANGLTNNNDFRAPVGRIERFAGETDEWEVALVQATISSDFPLVVEDVYVFCSLVPETQVVGSQSLNLLRSFTATSVPKTVGLATTNVTDWEERSSVVSWRPLATNSFSDITITVATAAGDLMATTSRSTFTIAIRHLTRS